MRTTTISRAARIVAALAALRLAKDAVKAVIVFCVISIALEATPVLPGSRPLIIDIDTAEVTSVLPVSATP
ncbi:MAG: hypothetical protein O2788_06100 [Chloroflexi bacterium]|nr:hypothetical protein [Chloroflexota bacterium]